MALLRYLISRIAVEAAITRSWREPNPHSRASNRDHASTDACLAWARTKEG
jgi:hypothetical protein